MQVFIFYTYENCPEDKINFLILGLYEILFVLNKFNLISRQLSYVNIKKNVLLHPISRGFYGTKNVSFRFFEEKT